MFCFAVNFAAVFAYANDSVNDPKQNYTYENIATSLSYEITNNSVTVCVIAKNAIFCALFMTLQYNNTSFVLRDAYLGDIGQGFELSYKDENGVISFLIDGVENCAPSSSCLVSFVFSIKDAMNGDFEFFLSSPVHDSAYVSDNDLLIGIQTTDYNLKISIFKDNDLCSVAVLDIKNDDSQLILTGKFRGDIGFSIVFEIFLHSSNGQTDKFLISKVISPALSLEAQNDFQEISAILEYQMKNISHVKAKAMIFYRDGNVSGDTVIYQITDNS